MATNTFIVEVAYATPEKQCILTVSVTEGCTVETAIDRSGIDSHFPDINLLTQSVGIFGKKVSLTHVVKAGDRIEIYRPLTIDPKEARRQRAIKAGQLLQKKRSS